MPCTVVTWAGQGRSEKLGGVEGAQDPGSSLSGKGG